MSKMKKVLAVILTAVMVMAMGMTSFAAPGTEDGSSITISGLTEGTNTTVKVYEVVKATPTAYNQWEIASWVPEGAIISTTNPWKIDMDKLGTPNDTAKVAEQEVEGTTVTFNNLDMGVYLITAVDANQKLVYKNMLVRTFEYDSDGLLTNKAETGSAKSAPNKTEKSRTEQSGNENDGVVEVGDTITYTITATVPNLRAANGVFWISDTLTGATYNNDAVVKIGGVTQNIELVNIKESNETFRYSLASLLTAANEGQLVTITYTATVLPGYDTVDNHANASNNPDGNDPHTQDVTSNFILTKYETDTTKALANAQFKVFKIKDGSVVYAKANADNYLTEWVTDESQATSFTTGTNGTFTLKGLNVGTYYAVETVAPQGYSVANPHKEATTETAYAATATIAKDGETVTAGAMTAYDTKLSGLPETGGIGTTIFTIGGCLIMIAAAALFFASRKRSQK